MINELEDANRDYLISNLDKVELKGYLDLYDIYKIVSIDHDIGDDNYGISYYGSNCQIIYIHPFYEYIDRFYNDGMKNHWSVLQNNKPLLVIPSSP